jgi:hypothetical protein
MMSEREERGRDEKKLEPFKKFIQCEDSSDRVKMEGTEEYFLVL